MGRERVFGCVPRGRGEKLDRMRVVRPLVASWLAVAACASGTESGGDSVDASAGVDAAIETDAAATDAAAKIGRAHV